MRLFATHRHFISSHTRAGLEIRFDRAKDCRNARDSRAEDWALCAWQRMQRLLETGVAVQLESDDGIHLASEDAVALDPESREDFELPPPWPGGLRLETHSVPNLPDFAAALRLIDEHGASVSDWTLTGPILTAGSNEEYLPTVAQFAALRAFAEWRQASERSEIDHLLLISALTEAAEGGCRLDLRQAGDIRVDRAEECVIAAEEQPDGSLELTPLLVGKFLPELEAEIASGQAGALALADPGEAAAARRRLYARKIAERLHQLSGEQRRAVLRIGRRMIVLSDEQTQQTRTLTQRRRVPRAERDHFSKDSAAWLANHVFVHGEVEFLPRVLGIGEWKGGYLGASGELGDKIDWFDKKPEPEKKPKTETEGEEREPREDEIDQGPTGEPASAGPLVPLIEKNDERLGWGLPHTLLAGKKRPEFRFDFSRHPRKPFPHQAEAIDWLAAHTARAGLPCRWRPDDRAWGAGALLADDMGLGKTLTSLLFIGEWFRAWRGVANSEPPACLIVAPLSLMENWREEIANSFAAGDQPFHRTVLAIPDGDLPRFYVTPNGRDVAVSGFSEGDGTVKQFGLRFGDGSKQSLDQPGTCVVTTYQTLREFRFSFAACEWSTAIFDEAQNLKNPNALQTIAAKSLKAFFRVALTGTPVENHLGDLWSLMDAVEPGALQSFAEFRSRWIRPLRGDPSRLAETGEALRQHLGALILRRTKEASLKGLPKKTPVPEKVAMTAAQAVLYDEILCVAVGGKAGSETATQRANRWLASMWELRRISLHPALLGDAAPAHARDAGQSRAYFSQSGKTGWLLETLDIIRAAGEKVLIFAVQKRLQEMLADHLGRIYGLTIPVINGDTKATSRVDPNSTRLGLIKQFSDRPGFGICVLSPIAAGAGLNIVAANHVIHLERHWNPAKEDQATDRAYRIGQTRDVKVYFPLLVHPRGITTFDLGLDKLIAQKRRLAGALGLAPVAAVSAEELFEEVFGTASRPTDGNACPIDLARASALSWEHFEALVAEIYSREADEVILTPRGSDRGADVVVLGYQGKNLLVQCKTTAGKELDSEFAIREVEGARPFFEKALGIRFDEGRIHTNANGFSRRTRKAGRLCNVSLHGADWLRDAVARHRVPLGQIIERNASRRRI